MEAQLFFLSLVLYSVAPVHPHSQGVVYREADIPTVRKLLVLEACSSSNTMMNLDGVVMHTFLFTMH